MHNYRSIKFSKSWIFTVFLVLTFTLGFFFGTRVYLYQAVPKAFFFQYPPVSSEAESKNNVIISVALGLPLQIVYRFIRSARASCNHCHLILFLHSEIISDKNFLQLADLYAVTFIPYDVWTSSDMSTNLPSINTVSLRWIVISQYLKHLEKMKMLYKYVFICDARDVMFQRNIFEYVKDQTEGLFVFQETNKIIIKNCPYNSKWIRDCYGESELDRLGNNAVICAGTILGSWKAMLDYLSLVEQITRSRYRHCNDQGIHNYIVHRSGVNNTKIYISTHEDGFVGTLGYSAAHFRNQFGVVLNQKGEVYAVLHQFDRVKQITDQYDAEYQLWPSYKQL